jgi:PfaD family protein
VSLDRFGDPSFREVYGVEAAYYAGAMANAIASEQMVIALSHKGLMGSFGSGGLSIERLQSAIETIQAAVPDGPYAFNLLHNPFEPHMEQQTVELFLKQGVRVVEAAAFVRLTPAIVQYRAAGLSRDPSGKITRANRVIAKISRREIAQLFLLPAPQKILEELVAEGRITREQAELAKQVPMADDITVEADSGGHTDNQPLVSLLPSIIAQRDQLGRETRYDEAVRIGAAGGISTPQAALAAFMMGAAYIVTGSVNQACVESGASPATRDMLAQAAMADVTMAPSADMFELGARVQVLKKGTLFAMRAQKLYDLYSNHSSIEEIPEITRLELEEKIFVRAVEQIWRDTVSFFKERDPEQIAKAEENPKKKMALIFRWYLGLSSRWARDGVQDRRMDYQVWCGPSMGAFNEWARGSYLEDPSNRHVTDVAWQLLTGCAYQYRVQSLKLQGVNLASELDAFYPMERHES